MCVCGLLCVWSVVCVLETVCVSVGNCIRKKIRWKGDNAYLLSILKLLYVHFIVYFLAFLCLWNACVCIQISSTEQLPLYM